MMATSAITKIEKLEPNGKVFFIHPPSIPHGECFFALESG
jgi:hypothetical protein